MKILIVSDQYYPLGGGIEQYLRGLGRQLMKMGHEVTTLTVSIPGCPDEDNWPEGRILRTPLLQNAITDPQAVLSRWAELAPVIKNLNPEVVYANHHTSLATIKACKVLSIPVVYGCHGWGLLCPMKIRFLKPDNSLCYNARSLVNCSECYKQLNLPRRITGFSTAKRYIEGFFGIKRKVNAKVAQYDYYQDILESADARIVLAGAWKGFFRSGTSVVLLGIDCDAFHPVPDEPFRQRYNIEGPYVLVTSRIHNTKGQDWAIRAMAHLPEEIKLVLAGNSSLFTGAKFEDNEHRRNAGRVIEELGLRDRIVFTGFLGAEELVQAYSGALSTIVPSIWLEAFGYVTAEAMACECPVVITGNCGSAELVDDGIQGYVVPRMDPRAMAEAALTILPRRREMGKDARDRMVQDLNWPKIAGDVLRVMEKVKH